MEEDCGREALAGIEKNVAMRREATLEVQGGYLDVSQGIQGGDLDGPSEEDQGMEDQMEWSWKEMFVISSDN